MRELETTGQRQDGKAPLRGVRAGSEVAFPATAGELSAARAGVGGSDRRSAEMDRVEQQIRTIHRIAEQHYEADPIGRLMYANKLIEQRLREYASRQVPLEVRSM